MDVAGDLPDSVEEDEIIETTATDSTRQRMLKLFPDRANEDTTDEQETQDNQFTLSSGEKPTDTTEKPTVAASPIPRPKPNIDVKKFAPPDTKSGEKPKPAIGSTAQDRPIKSPTEPKPNIAKPAVARQDKQTTGVSTSKPTIKPKPEDIDVEKSVASITSGDSTILRPTADTTKATEPVSKKPLAKPIKPSPIFDVEEPADESSAQKKEKLPTAGIPKAKPTQTEKPEITEDQDKSEETSLASTVKQRKTRFDDIDKSDDETEEENDILEASTTSAAFSRPFVKRDLIDLDEGDDEEVDDVSKTDDTAFARPFAPDHNKAHVSRRDQLTSPLDDSDDDEDESIATSRPRTSSIFDSLSKTSDDTSKSTSSWRDQLTSPLDDSDDDEDESIATSRPRTSSIFDSLNKTSDDTSKSPSSWRDQLTSSLDDSDDDEDESIATSRPRTSSIFDSLNKTSDDTSKSPSSWRDQLTSSLDDSDDDEDESIATSRTRTSSII